MSSKVETIDRKKIGKELRKVRMTNGQRQDFIAKKLRIDSSKLCRMEKGDFGPWSLKFVERWKTALGLQTPTQTNGKPTDKSPKRSGSKKANRIPRNK